MSSRLSPVGKTRQYEREQVRDYLASIRTAHGAIRFLGLPTLQDHQDMRIDRLFVEPQVSRATPSRRERNPEWLDDRRPLGEVVAGDHRLVILGDPGSGKSTLVDWLAWQLADEHPNAWKALLGSRIPIPLILRDLRTHPWDHLGRAARRLPDPSDRKTPVPGVPPPTDG